MTIDAPAVPPLPTEQQKVSDKEFNFRQLESKYSKEILKEREHRAELERKLQQLQASQAQEEDDNSEPYVDNKKLDRKLSKLNASTQSDIQKAMDRVKVEAKEEVRRDLWLEANPDFYEVLNHAEKFAQTNPMLAETILTMPDTFERKKLVYANIKAMGIDKPKGKEPSIQEVIDSNRKNVYYAPTGIPNAPFQPQGDFSEAGQKEAYKKMQESKKRLRLG